jgi:hypothetical protein
MGYRGSAAGLRDPATNMTHAVRYLAGADRAADANESRAVAVCKMPRTGRSSAQAVVGRLTAVRRAVLVIERRRGANSRSDDRPRTGGA